MGTMLKDGHSTVITFASASSGVSVIFEKEVTPPGVSGGGGIDVTTMLNVDYRTMEPKSLKTLTPGSFIAGYDPAILDEMIAMVNVNQLITITYPDGSSWAFFAFIDEFTPNNLVEGDFPTANITIIPTNVNGAGVETDPVYAAA